MDDLDRLYHRLVHNIRTNRPEYLNLPFTIQQLYEQLVPYRHNRRELAIESNQDYETAVARLLSGERNYITSDPVVREALKRELASPVGEHGIFKEYANSQIALTAGIEATNTGESVSTPTDTSAHTDTAAYTNTNTETTTPPAVDKVETTDAPETEKSTPSATQTGATLAYDVMTPSATEPAATQPPVPSLLSSLSQINVPTGCSFCGGTLPTDRDVNYCPHCGENLKTKRCPGCGSEMDTKWRFCVTCGRRAT
jgi:hypothetical protein